MKTVIAGGGPAGMMLGWLLARAGLEVVVLEKHRDFFRDFRGDTIHPSTLDVMDELGVADELLRLPHSQIAQLQFDVLGERVPGLDLTNITSRHHFIAMMPQWDFLDFVQRKASALPTFELLMQAEVAGLLLEDRRVTGVRLADGRELRGLVIGCDGRSSTVRTQAGLHREVLGAPIDVLWFRVPRLPQDETSAFGIANASAFVVMIDRRDYWQCAFLIAKGGLAALKAKGLDAFRASVRELAPWLGDRVGALRAWDDVKLLTVEVDRLTTWARPGVLCIGDAAHAMSPVGGVGINLAIQDAVAAANLLAEPLRQGTPTIDDLLAVQLRRERATIKTQTLQLRLHELLLAKIVRGHAGPRLRLARWMLRHVPALRRYLAQSIGVGFTPEHVAA